MVLRAVMRLERVHDEEDLKTLMRGDNHQNGPLSILLPGVYRDHSGRLPGRFPLPIASKTKGF